MPKDSELITVENGRVYHLRLLKAQLARNIILCGDPGRVDLVVEYFDPGSLTHSGQNREFAVRTGAYQGRPVTVIGTGIGTDNMEIVLIEAYALNEFAKAGEEKPKGLTIIRVGTCGTPQKDIKVGSLAVSTYAVGLDSTGLFYDLPEGRLQAVTLMIEREARKMIETAGSETARFKGRIFPYASEASPEVAGALTKQARGDHVTGITLTAPGFFAPQGRAITGLAPTAPGLLESLTALQVEGRQVVNIEMETSLLFHLAKMMDYRAGAVCAVIANRATGEFLEHHEPAVRRAVITALEALVDLDQRRAIPPRP